RGVLVSISGGRDMTLFEVDEAATRIREEVGDDAEIIVGAIFDDKLEGVFRVSVVAAGLASETDMQAGESGHAEALRA
ncbi:MAG: cell division protein FtsZ, partial [Nitratireductor sp.]